MIVHDPPTKQQCHVSTDREAVPNLRTQLLTSHIDWRRVGRRTFLAAVFVLALVQLFLSTHSNQYGLDFRGGTWHAGREVLAGRTPYPHPLVGVALMMQPSGFMTPPPLALLGIPFSLLPYSAAIAAFNVFCAFALLCALRLLGVSDKRVYVLAVCSFPFVSSLALGQPDGVFALCAALAWRYRDSWPGALAAAAVIAMKLLAWPLLIWFIATRRFRQASLAAAGSVLILVGSWACIGFHGMSPYLKLLSDDAKTYENKSHSLVAGFMHLGLSSRTAGLLTILTAAAIAAATVVVSRGSDQGWFSSAIVLGILMSPIVWDHYLVLLLVCLAAARQTRDPLFWLLTAALWLAPSENPPGVWQAWLVPVVTAAAALRLGALCREDSVERELRVSERASKRRRPSLSTRAEVGNYRPGVGLLARKLLARDGA